MTGYWKNVASVLTGSVIAQMIPVLGSLIIARFYAPAEFGLFSAWLGLVMLLAVVLTLRYEMTLAIEDDGQPRSLAVLATALAVFAVSCFVVIFLLLCFLLVPERLEKYPLMLVLTWLPTALLVAVSNIWQSWAAADGEYRKLSYMRIVQTSTVTFFQILAGIVHSSAVSLALAQLSGILLACSLSIYMLPLRRICNSENVKGVFAFWKRQRRFPLYSLPAGFINTAAAQLPLLIVAYRFGADIAGFLALTMRVLGAPVGLLGKSVLDVFKRYAAISYRENGECRSEYIRTFKVLALGSFAFCVVMFFGSEQIFLIAFGKKWAGAGIIAIWLLPLFGLRFMVSPLSYMTYIAEKQHLDLYWQLGLLGITLLCLGTLSGYELALQSYSLGYSLLYLIYLAMSYRFSLGVVH